MHYGNIKWLSIENGDGVRVSLFVSGCRNKCKHCFSQCTWDFNYGQVFTNETLKSLLNGLKMPYIQGLTILGGEPLEPENQKTVLDIIKAVKTTYPDKDIWLYTGFVLQEDKTIKDPINKDIQNRGNTPYLHEILNLIDVLVDGRFEEDKKDISLKFRGSSNQRIIKMHP